MTQSTIDLLRQILPTDTADMVIRLIELDVKIAVNDAIIKMYQNQI